MDNMVEVKTSELEGAALDWAVAKAVGQELMQNMWIVSNTICSQTGEWEEEDWSPSTDWAQGGPLIEKYMCDVECVDIDHRKEWESHAYRNNGSHACSSGDTALVSVMRAIVCLEMGEMVQVPKELAS